MRQWLTYNYVASGGDVALQWCGMGYNVAKGQWENVSGVNLSASNAPMSRRTLRACDIRVQTAGGATKRGVYVTAWIVGDGINTGLLVPWFDGIQGCQNLVHWAGSMPMMHGFVWRIHLAGLVATDLVSCGVCYE